MFVLRVIEPNPGSAQMILRCVWCGVVWCVYVVRVCVCVFVSVRVWCGVCVCVCVCVCDSLPLERN